jgi:hypothetical protein
LDLNRTICSVSRRIGCSCCDDGFLFVKITWNACRCRRHFNSAGIFSDNDNLVNRHDSGREYVEVGDALNDGRSYIADNNQQGAAVLVETLVVDGECDGNRGRLCAGTAKVERSHDLGDNLAVICGAIVDVRRLECRLSLRRKLELDCGFASCHGIDVILKRHWARFNDSCSTIHGGDCDKRKTNVFASELGRRNLAGDMKVQ